MRSCNLALLPLAAAAATAAAVHGSKLLAANDGAVASSYDYIVVGGGTSGLVVAKRLSEDPKTSVLVIEAGGSVRDNVNVTDPLGYGRAFGSAIDWQYETTEQQFAGGAKQTLRAGKALGGTSTINGMAYTRAQASQIDAWEKLGNKGWNWKSLLPYYLKSERFQAPNSIRATSAGLTYVPEYHGLQGPLLTGWPYGMTNKSITTLINDTAKAMGVPWNADLNGGAMAGYSIFPSTVDQSLNVRADAARSYYYPFQQAQPNLQVMLHTQATRLTWAADASVPTADGVEILAADGTRSTVRARREVILSGGTLKTPLLLEASGIGNPAILAKHGIRTVVDLPTVGENLQDQMNNGLRYAVANNYSAAEKNTMVIYPAATHLLGNETAAAAAELKAALPGYAQRVAAASGNATSAAHMLRFFQIQYDLMFDAAGQATDIPLAEVLISQQNGVWDSEYWALLPFSRGSVHLGGPDAATSINSSSTAATQPPLINPNYFMLDWDMTKQAASAAFIRRLFNTAPFVQYVEAELQPGLAAVARDAPLAQWSGFIKKQYRSNFHPVGTAAMMPRDQGGVVDPELKVYGTANVRVVDASVLPFQVCGHLVSTLYAVAERVSDMIKKSG